MNKFKYLLMVALAALFIFSCKKDKKEDFDSNITVQEGNKLTFEDLAKAIESRTYRSDLIRDFFSKSNVLESRDAIPEADIANQILYELDSEDPEIENWITDYGMPCWECATTGDFGELFNVTIPFYKNNELTAVIAFLSPDNEGVYLHVRLKRFNEHLEGLEVSNSLSSGVDYFKFLFDSYSIQGQNSIQGGGENISNAQVENRGPCDCDSELYGFTLSGGQGNFINAQDFTNDQPSWCLCEGDEVATACCTIGGLPVLDGGVAEAGFYGINWVFVQALWNQLYGAGSVGGQGGSPNGQNNEINDNKESWRLLNQSRNEQLVIDWLITYFQGNSEGNLDSDMVLAIGSNPLMATSLFLYLQNYYDDIIPSNAVALALINLYIDHPLITLTSYELEHILTFESSLISAIDIFINNHAENDPFVMLAIHGLFTAQMCIDQQNSGSCEPINLPNNFTAIYNFYIQNGNGVFSALSGLNGGYALTNVQKIVFTYLVTHPALSTLQNEAILKYISLVASGQNLPNLEEFVNNYVILMGELDPVFNFSVTEEDWLLVNWEFIPELDNFYSSHTDEVAKDIGNLYVDLLMNDADFAALIEEMPAIPGWIWPIIREIGIEVAIELAKKAVPGLSQYDDVLDAVANLANGGTVLEFLYDVGQEVVQFAAQNGNPFFKMASLSLDAFNLSSKGAKVWRAIARMEQFGSGMIEKLIGLINTKAGGVLGKFEWKNQNTGATLIDVGNPQDFVDDFLALFPDVNGPLFLNPTQPLEQTYQIGSSLTIKFYPVSNTTGGPTLSFIGSPNFKIRFS